MRIKTNLRWVNSFTKKLQNPRTSASSYTADILALRLGASVAGLLIVAATTWGLMQLHEMAKTRISASAQHRVLALDQTIEGAIDSIDLSLLASADEISRQLSAGRADPKSITAMLIRQQNRLPMADNLRASDERGEVLYGSGTDSPPLNISNRGNFLQAINNPDAGLYISKAMVGLHKDRWLWLFSRRINKADGSFGGVVIASVFLDQIENILAKTSFDAGGVATIRDADLGMIARYLSGATNTIPYGDRRVPQPFTAALQTAPQAGSYESGDASIDGINRFHAYLRNAKYGYLINAGISSEAALSEWRRQAGIAAGMLAAFLLSSAALVWQIGRAWRRKEMALEEIRKGEDRFRTLTRMSSDFYWTTDVEHRITSRNTNVYPHSLLGWATGIGQRRWDIPSLSPDEAGWRAHRATLDTRQSFRNFAITRLGKDGVVRHLLLSGDPIFTAEGDFTGYHGVGKDTTEIKIAADNLRVAATAFESQEGMMIMDANHVVLRINLAFTEMMGFTAAEAVGQTARMLRTPRHDDAFYAAMWETIDRCGKWQGEVWNRCKNGEDLSVWLMISAVRGQEGAVTHYVATQTDITERKRGEQALQESEERFRSLTEMSSDFYWETDCEHRFTMRSSALDVEILPPWRTTVGQRRWELPSLTPDEAGWLAHRAVLDARQPFRQFELSRRGGMGAVHHLSLSGDPIFDTAGNFTGYRGVGKDITERKLSDEKLRIAAIAFEAQEGILITDSNNVVLQINRALTETTGYTAKDFRGKTAALLRSTRYKPDFYAAIWESIHRNGTWHGEVWIRRKNGEDFPVLLSITAVRGQDGTVTHYVHTRTDISERKKEELKRIQATQDLWRTLDLVERKERAKSEYLVATNHDLRQPLCAAQLSAHSLSLTPLDGQQLTFLKRVQLSLTDMFDQVKSLLDASRLEKSEYQLFEHDIPTTELFQNLARTFDPIAQAANVQLLFRAGETVLHTDHKLMTRLLGNLIDNAIKFSPGGIVLVCVRRSKNGQRLQVRDNGQGMAVIHHQSVFDDFYQIGNREGGPNTGYGLGLSIVSRLARLLGCRISMTSAIGKGSAFSLFIPNSREPKH